MCSFAHVVCEERQDSACPDVAPVGEAMDEREMTSGVIPLRHASLPGDVKLPRRYEKAAMGSKGIPTRVRKISIQPGHSALGESLSDRMQDLMSAVLWIKQELIQLRQHDILLKRQFFHIQHSIQHLHKHRQQAALCSLARLHNNNNHPVTADHNHHHPHTNHLCPAALNGEAAIAEETGGGPQSLDDDGRVQGVAETVPGVSEDSEFLEALAVRSSSVTMLNESEEEEEDADTFAEEFFCRPRTSSMRTSRDMAALARRRGSKELI